MKLQRQLRKDIDVSLVPFGFGALQNPFGSKFSV